MFSSNKLNKLLLVKYDGCELVKLSFRGKFRAVYKHDNSLFVSKKTLLNTWMLMVEQYPLNQIQLNARYAKSIIHRIILTNDMGMVVIFELHIVRPTSHDVHGTSTILILSSLSSHLHSDTCIPLQCVPLSNKLLFYSDYSQRGINVRIK